MKLKARLNGGPFLFYVIHILKNGLKKFFFKIFVLTFFSYLCLPKKRGASACPYSAENSSFFMPK